MQHFIFDHVTFTTSKHAAVYKISWKSNNFSLRYGAISIFKMAAVRHLWIVLPPHETTHEVSVAGRSCLSNFMSMWYTDLKIFEFFQIFGLKCLFRPTKWGFWGTFGPLNVNIHHRDPQKAHHCVNQHLLSYKNPLRGLTCRQVHRKCDEQTQTDTHR